MTRNSCYFSVLRGAFRGGVTRAGRGELPTTTSPLLAAMLVAAGSFGAGCNDSSAVSPVTQDGGSSGGAGKADRGATADVCDTYFELVKTCPQHMFFALHSPYPPYPSQPSDRLSAMADSDLARLRSRLRVQCEARRDLPGSGLTASAASACLAAVRAGGCDRVDTSPDCRFSGTLPAGAACVLVETQCADGVCGDASPPFCGPGERPEPTCGTCMKVAPIGEDCGSSGGAPAFGSCEAGFFCECTDCSAGSPSGSPGPSGSPRCVALHKQGEACNGSASCEAGFFCQYPDGPSGSPRCVALHKQGEACTESSECVVPLFCQLADLMQPDRGTCRGPGTDGDPCQGDSECKGDLGCVRDPVPSTGKCGKLTFADGGEACDQDARCKMGYCLSTGKCPRVIADGEPCTVYNGVFAPPQDAAICDAYSSCVDGKCAPSPYPTCDAAPSADEPVDAGAAGTSAVTPMPCSGALPAPVDVKCPSAQPSEGDACELPTPLPGQGVNLATCTYDKTPCACQPSAKGDGFVWTCEQCPAQKPTAGEACEPLPLIGLCGYADETCGCAPNANGNAWACQACPDAAPANGDSCQVPRLRCGFELKACTCMGWFSPPPPPPHGGPGMRPSSVAPVWICECKIISDECVACMRSACSEPYTAADRAGFAPACDSNSDGCSLPALATCLCDAQTANGPQAACFSAFQTAGDQLAIDLYACTRDACATECGFK